LQLAVIVAVGAMGMMQVSIHQVIEVIPVRHRLMPTVHAVNVRFVMTGTLVARRAFLGICRGHLDAVVVHVVAVSMVQVPIVKVVHMAVVLHSDMATVRAMLVAVSA
jgi:hypothetical protein